MSYAVSNAFWVFSVLYIVHLLFSFLRFTGKDFRKKGADVSCVHGYIFLAIAIVAPVLVQVFAAYASVLKYFPSEPQQQGLFFYILFHALTSCTLTTLIAVECATLGLYKGILPYSGPFLVFSLILDFVYLLTVCFFTASPFKAFYMNELVPFSSESQVSAMVLYAACVFSSGFVLFYGYVEANADVAAARGLGQGEADV